MCCVVLLDNTPGPTTEKAPKQRLMCHPASGLSWPSHDQHAAECKHATDMQDSMSLPFDQGLDISPLCCSHIALIPVLIFSKISSVLQHICIAWQRIICSNHTVLGETH